MNRVLFSILAIFVSLFAFVFSLVMVIPLTIAAIITGKKLQNQFKAKTQHSSSETHSAIEGEFEDVSNKKEEK